MTGGAGFGGQPMCLTTNPPPLCPLQALPGKPHGKQKGINLSFRPETCDGGGDIFYSKKKAFP